MKDKQIEKTCCLFGLQISFLLPIDTVPGRMGFLLTLFLCMVNILNWAARYSPKSGANATAIIQWILSCSLFIIIAILEYAAILSYKKYKKPTIGQEMCASFTSSGKVEEMSKRLDKVMVGIFPLAFVAYSAVFWSSKWYAIL